MTYPANLQQLLSGNSFDLNMKKILFISLFFFSFNAFAEHDVCIAIYPTPPECLHEEEKNNNNNLLIGAALLVGGYYLFKDGGNEPTALYVSSGTVSYTHLPLPTILLV